MKQQVRIYRPGPPGIEILHVWNGSGRIPAYVHTAWYLALVERGKRITPAAGQDTSQAPGQFVRTCQ